MNSTLMTALAYCCAVPVALLQRLVPALQLSAEYLLFLMREADALPEMTTAPTLALVEAIDAVATPVKAPPSKTTRKTSTPKTSTATTATTTRRSGKRATVLATAD